MFLPQHAESQRKCIALFEDTIRHEGQQLLGWRDVPVHNEYLGTIARKAEPVMRQVFIADDVIAKGDDVLRDDALPEPQGHRPENPASSAFDEAHPAFAVASSPVPVESQKTSSRVSHEFGKWCQFL